MKAESEAWLRHWCSTNDAPSYEDVMAALQGHQLDDDDDDDYRRSYSDEGEYITFYGQDAHASIPPEFWDHFEIVTGTKRGQRERPESFSCSC